MISVILIGPILSRELRSLARRPRTFRRRCSLSIAVLLSVGLPYLLFAIVNRGPLSSRSMAVFSEFVIVNVIFTQIVLTIWLVPACVAVVVAEEKERRTLTHLAMTRLTSAEIVVGKLAAGLVQYAAWLATGLPMLILLPLLGGVDPRWVLLITAGTASTAYFVAGLSIVVSTAAPRAGKAVGEAAGLTMLWVIVPFLVQLLVPLRLPRLWPWVKPVNDWVLASSPSSLLMAALGRGMGPGWRLLDSIAWMIGLQIAVGTLVVAYAVAGFRRACRRYEENDGATTGLDSLHSELWAEVGEGLLQRPPCGENPVLWKELHTLRPRRFAELLGVLVAFGFVILLGYVTFSFARPAFVEQSDYGLDPAGPVVRRMEFNQFLRFVTSLIEFLTVLAAAGVAAAGVTEERARETWDSLLATPLGAREIIHAKMIGAAWKVRWVALILVALWSVGVLAGSIHPIGLGAALLLLVAWMWLMTALGTYASLVSRDTAQASNRALIPALLLSGSFLACYLLPRNTTVVLGAGSAPFVNWLSLVSHADVREIVIDRGQKPFGPIREAGLNTGERPWGVLTAYLLTTLASMCAAAWLSRAAVARFDRAAGRPERRATGRDEPVATERRPSLEDEAQHESGGAEQRRTLAV